MSGKRYPEEFKIQAVEQVTKQGHSLSSVAERLGISYKSLSDWVKRYDGTRHIKGSRRVLCRGVKEKYTFVRERLPRYPDKVMCQILNIERSGFYAWLQQPLSARAKEDRRLLGKIKQFWLESGCTYGYRNITIDLKSDGETCGKNGVHRLMLEASIQDSKVAK